MVDFSDIDFSDIANAAGFFSDPVGHVVSALTGGQGVIPFKVLRVLLFVEAASIRREWCYIHGRCLVVRRLFRPGDHVRFCEARLASHCVRCCSRFLIGNLPDTALQRMSRFAGLETPVIEFMCFTVKHGKLWVLRIVRAVHNSEIVESPCAVSEELGRHTLRVALSSIVRPRHRCIIEGGVAALGGVLGGAGGVFLGSATHVVSTTATSYLLWVIPCGTHIVTTAVPIVAGGPLVWGALLAIAAIGLGWHGAEQVLNIFEDKFDDTNAGASYFMLYTGDMQWVSKMCVSFLDTSDGDGRYIHVYANSGTRVRVPSSAVSIRVRFEVWWLGKWHDQPAFARKYDAPCNLEFGIQGCSLEFGIQGVWDAVRSPSVIISPKPFSRLVEYTNNGAWASRMRVEFTVGDTEGVSEEHGTGSRRVVLPIGARNIRISFHVYRVGEAFIPNWHPIPKSDKIEARGETKYVFTYQAPRHVSFTLGGFIWKEEVLEECFLSEEG